MGNWIRSSSRAGVSVFNREVLPHPRKDLEPFALWLLETPLGTVGQKDHLSGIVQKGKTLGRDLYRAGGAPEQDGVQLFFQGMDLLSYSGLGHVKPLGGPGEIQGFRHGEKTGELKDVQRVTSMDP